MRSMSLRQNAALCLADEIGYGVNVVLPRGRLTVTNRTFTASRTTTIAFALATLLPCLAKAQTAPSMGPPSIDEETGQQDQLVAGAAAKSIASQSQGQDSVGPDGSFSYTIPIRTLQAVRGMQPQLSLVYNSRVSNGLTGVGWTLRGIPEIHRINGGRGINFDGDDQYAVNFGGWGAPDDPGLRLVYIGTDPRTRAARTDDAISQILLNLAKYVFTWVWQLPAVEVTQLLNSATNSDPTYPPLHLKGPDVPSADVMGFVANPAGPAPTPAPVSSEVLATWNQNFDTRGFSWPCETTAVRCWLRVLKIDISDWPILGLLPFGSDIFHTSNETWGEYRPSLQTCGDGPCFWVLRDGKGNTYYFGGDAAYHATAADGSGAYPVIPERFNGDRGFRGILMWSLYEVVDRYGNGYKVSYTKVGTQGPTLVPSEIDYFKTGGATIAKAIAFSYESRPDNAPMPAYFDTRLKTISMEVGGQVTRKYSLTYETGESSRSRLITVQELGPDGSTTNGLPPYQITWTDPRSSGFTQMTTTSPFTFLPYAAPLVADFNGDGFSDVLFATEDYHGLSRWYSYGSATGMGNFVEQVSGDTWNASASPPGSFTTGWAFTAGDVNGDGYADLIRVQLGPDRISLDVGAGGAAGVANFDTPRSLSWSGSADYNDWGNWHVLSADINNDRVADVVMVHPGAPTVVYALGSRSGGLQQPIALTTTVAKLPQFALILEWSGGPEPANAAVISNVFVGDLNGDGYLDVITTLSTLLSNKAWNPTPQINYFLGSDAGPRPPIKWVPPQGQQTLIDPVIGDINGDGRSDLVLGDQQIFYGRSDVNSPLVMMPGYTPGDPGMIAWSGGIGDQNGDGIADLVGGALGSPNGKMVEGLFNPPFSLYESTFYADVNGDGLQDRLSFSHVPTDSDLIVELGLANGTIGAQIDVGNCPGTGGDDNDVSLSANPRKIAHAITGDFNGDGVQDVLTYPYYLYNPSAPLSGPTKTLPPYLHTSLPVALSHGMQADVINTVTNTTGGKVSVTFLPAPQMKGAINSASGGFGRPNTSPRLLTSRIVRDPGLKGPVRSYVYGYLDGRVRPGAVFEDNDLGFAEVDVGDEQTKLVQKYKFTQSYPQQRHIVEADSLDAKANLLRMDTYTYNYLTPYSGINLVQIATQISNRYEAGVLTSTTKATFDYDEYGAVLDNLKTTSNNLLGTEYSYTHDANNWLLGRTDSKRIYSRIALINVFPTPPDRIEGWELNTFAANGIDLTETNQLLCANESQCTCPRGQSCTPASARWVPVAQSMTYDSQGNLSYSADAYGHGLTYGHDANWGGITSVSRTVTDNGRPVTLTKTKQYDSLGHLSGETDENGVATTYSYDGFDRLRRVDRPNGSHQFSDYDNWGNPLLQTLVSTTGPYVTSASANLPLGEVVTQFLDGFGNVYREDTTAGEGQVTTRQRVESFSNGTRTVAYNRPTFLANNLYPPQLATNEWLSISFDAANRPLTVTSLPGGTTVESFTYAALKMTSFGLNGDTVTTTFDTRGRVLSQADGYGTWSYAFDPVDRLLSVVMPNGTQLQFGYDTWGRRNNTTDSILGNIALVLDDVGNMISSTDANGPVSYTYDESGRPQMRTDALGVIKYTYDRSTADFTMGRLASVTDHSGSTSLKYDAAGRVAERSRTITGLSQPLVADYGYDFFDRLQTKTLGTTTLGFSYPDGRNLRQILLNGQQMASFSNYDPNRLPGKRQTSAAITTIGRDARGLISDLVTTATNGAVLQKLHADNDLVGTTKDIFDQRASLTEGSTDTDESLYYRYDFDNRLVLATNSRSSTTFGYDAQGNMNRKGTLAFTSSGKQLVATTGTATTATLTYDAVGNVETRDDSLGHWIYTYDQDHRLTAASLNGASRFSAAYDYSGARVKKVFTKPSGETVTTFYSDGMEVRQDSASPTTSTTIQVGAAQVGTVASVTTGEIMGQPTVASELAYATTLWSGDTSSGPATGTLFFHANTLGNPSVITDANGDVVSHGLYEPFGELMTTSSVGHDVATPKFVGKEGDPETGFVYFGGRYYDPLFSRFVTPDSNIPGGAVAPQGFNRYSYALNNPIRRHDPDGHDPAGALVGAGIGALGGFIVGVAQQGLSLANGNDFSWRAVGATTAGGATFGAIVGLTDGLDLGHATAAATWAQASIIGGTVQRAVLGQPTTANDIAKDAAIGTATYGVATVVAPAAAQWLNQAVDDFMHPVPMLEPAAPASVTPSGGAPVTVYTSQNAAGEVNYVGITNDIERRSVEQFSSKGIIIREIPGLPTDMTRSTARGVEQALINQFGLEADGGSLINKINSIATSNPLYDSLVSAGEQILSDIGFPGFSSAGTTE